MEITQQQLLDIIEITVIRTVEQLKIVEQPTYFRSKSALARHVGCNRRTIDSMIDRGQVIVGRDGSYKLNNNIKN